MSIVDSTLVGSALVQCVKTSDSSSAPIRRSVNCRTLHLADDRRSADFFRGRRPQRRRSGRSPFTIDERSRSRNRDRTPCRWKSVTEARSICQESRRNRHRPATRRGRRTPSAVSIQSRHGLGKRNIIASRLTDNRPPADIRLKGIMRSN